MISAIKVLNTVTPATAASGADVFVGSDGILNIASVETVDAYNVRGVSITVPQTEVSGVVVVTPTAADSLPYTFYINAFSMTTGLPKVINVSFNSGAGATATSIANQARAIINADTDLSVVASGTTTLILTAKATQPFFVVGGALGNVDSYSNLPLSSTTPIATNIAATNNTGSGGVNGRSVRGSVAYLQNKYAYSANGNALTQSELALLTPGFFYTEVVIDYISTTPSGSGAFKGEISTLQAVVLVRANSDGSSSVFTTTNYADLLGSYGTITGLAAGYRVEGALITGTAGALSGQTQTVTSGVLATTDGIISGDFLVSVTTPVVSRVISVLSNTTYVSSNATALTSASTINGFKWRPLPL